MHVILLNADYTYLNTVPWRKALRLLFKGKAEILNESENEIMCSNKSSYRIPTVLKLSYLVRKVYQSTIPYSRKNVYIRDGFRCQYCGKEDRLSIDHVMPQSRGGQSNFNNCVASCLICNKKKDNRTPEEAGMPLLSVPHRPTIIEFLNFKVKDSGALDYLKQLGIY